MACSCQDLQPTGIRGQDSNRKPLDPQQGVGYELGLKGSFNDDKLNASLALFKIKQDNLPVFTGRFDEYTAEEGTTTEGGELSLDGELADGWQAMAGYAYSWVVYGEPRNVMTSVEYRF